MAISRSDGKSLTHIGGTKYVDSDGNIQEGYALGIVMLNENKIDENRGVAVVFMPTEEIKQNPVFRQAVYNLTGDWVT